MEHRTSGTSTAGSSRPPTALRLPPMDADVTKLSGGERRRVALCKLLMRAPGHPAARRADQPPGRRHGRVARAPPGRVPGHVILITHDRYFLDNVVGWMLEIERGKATPYKGNYSDYLEAKQKILDTKRQSGLAHANKMIKREREWLGRHPGARATSRTRRASSATRSWSRSARRRTARVGVELRIPPGPRLGDKVIELRNVSKGFGERTLIKDLLRPAAGRHPGRRRRQRHGQDHPAAR